MFIDPDRIETFEGGRTLREAISDHNDFKRPKSSALNVATAVYAGAIDRMRTKGIRRGLRASVRLLFNMKQLYELIATLNEPNSVALARLQPGLIYKYQSRYLAKSFNRSQRRAILKFHYKFMGDAVNPRFYARLIAGNIVLWRSVQDREPVSISLRVPEHGHEGDLSLVLEMERRQIYELSFTIVPGSVIGVSACSAIFVARVQGRKGQFDEIRRATKLCRDVSPPHLLMAAAEGIGNALGIRFVVGVGADDQLSANKTFDYTSFWETLLCQKTGDRFYVLPLPMAGVPLEQCNPSHRRRTRLKREFKVSLSKTVETALVSELKSPSLNSRLIGDGEGVKGLRHSVHRWVSLIELHSTRPSAFSAKYRDTLHPFLPKDCDHTG